MKADTTYHLHQSLGYQLSLTSRLQERRFDERLKQLGLTRITWCILLAVGYEDLSQPSEIANFVGIDRTATSRALRQLEKDEMIIRNSGKDDRRTTTVKLTAKGRDLVHTVVPIAKQNSATLEDKLTQTESSELRRLLAKLREGEETALSHL